VTLPVDETFTYRDPLSAVRLPLGTEVIVPFGSRQVTGFVVGIQKPRPARCVTLLRWWATDPRSRNR